MDVENRICVVTGGASGIGLEIAREYKENGAHVVSLDIHPPISPVEEIEFLSCDVTDRENVSHCIEEIVSRFGKIDVLVASAGIHRKTPFLDLQYDEFDEMINIHLKGTYNVVKSVVPTMMEQQYGKIITIASVAGLIGAGVEPASHYAAAKGGVISFTKSIAREFGSHGIVANTIAPGLIETPLTSNFEPENKQRYIQSIPLKRIGTPKDVTGLAVFLASPQSDYITGQVICVDGGYLMR
jgi:3-oxoacyl-[acyl-carrier protein] reductase